MKLNQYPTMCITCKVKRPAGHGKIVKVGSKWATDCLPVLAMVHNDDDGYDAVKDSLCESGDWRSRR